MCFSHENRKKAKRQYFGEFYIILKELAENYDFENREEVIIRDIFITNMSDDDIQRELLRDTVDPESTQYSWKYGDGQSKTTTDFIKQN